jgi:hypothetical protein
LSDQSLVLLVVLVIPVVPVVPVAPVVLVVLGLLVDYVGSSGNMPGLWEFIRSLLRTSTQVISDPRAHAISDPRRWISYYIRGISYFSRPCISHPLMYPLPCRDHGPSPYIAMSLVVLVLVVLLLLLLLKSQLLLLLSAFAVTVGVIVGVGVRAAVALPLLPRTS